MKRRIVIAATGASGGIYLQRLLQCLEETGEAEIHLALSAHARSVIKDELGELRVPSGTQVYNEKSMYVPFTSGSAVFDAMVIVPCSMGTLGRIAAGVADNNIVRGADVFLKERRKLILVPRETPWNLIHARNMVTLLEAGAVVLPASPSFYSKPTTIEEVADTVVHRIMDQLGIPFPKAFRWKSAAEERD